MHSLFFNKTNLSKGCYSVRNLTHNVGNSLQECNHGKILSRHISNFLTILFN